MATRYIGIQHRVKKTAKGEAHPTRIAVLCGDHKPKAYELEDETAELDFVRGRFPTSWRDIELTEDPTILPSHHVKWRATKEDDDLSAVPATHQRKVGKKIEIATKVPAGYDGLQTGDVVGSVSGGSGNRFMYALTRMGDRIGAEVYRIPPRHLKEQRSSDDRSNDHLLIAQLVDQRRELFHRVGSRELTLIRVEELLRDRMDAMKARIACDQRVRTQAIGAVFLGEPDVYPEGPLEDMFDKARASSTRLQLLVEDESDATKALRASVRETDIWQNVLANVEGCGEILAAPIVVAIGDVARFDSDAHLKAALGVHVMCGGKHEDRPTHLQFPRHRGGETGNWNNPARQALFLLADQFNRRPESRWGKYLLNMKARQRALHPDVMCSVCGVPWEQHTAPAQGGKEKVKHAKMFTPGHIHKRASWRTLSRFVEWLYTELTRIERARRAAQPTSGEPTSAAA